MSALEAKVVVLGSANTGKTSLVHRLVHSNFLTPAAPSTVGASFVTTRIQDPDSQATIRLQIWDTAGQERFRSISRLYYRGAHAAVLCYDITSKRSFDEMGTWLRELRDSLGSNSPNSPGSNVIVHIVGTKADIVADDPSKREVPFERCIEYVQRELYAEPVSSNLEASKRQAQPANSQLARSWSSARTRPQPKTAMTEKKSLASDAQRVSSSQANVSTKRSSGFWGTQETVWDCCHEISAKDGSGIDQVFKIITRKLVEQQRLRLETQLAIDASMGRAPGVERPLEKISALHSMVTTPAVAGKGGGGPMTAQTGYFDFPASQGSFRLGYGDKRRSWLGLTTDSSLTTPGALSSVAYTVDENADIDVSKVQSRGGRCC